MKKKVILMAVLALVFTGCSSIDINNSSKADISENSSIELSIPEDTTNKEQESSAEETTETTTIQTTPQTMVETAVEITPVSTKGPDVTQKPGMAPDDYKVMGESGILVSGQGGHYWGIMFYGGLYEYCDDYVATVKRYADQLPSVNVYSMVIPTSVDFYCPEEYKGHTSSQKEKIDYIEESLKGSKVTNVNVYNSLSSHTKENIYARTDHHWLPLGAYYGAKSFAETAKLSFPDISKYEAVSRNDFVGSMYFYSEDINIKNDPEVFTLYLSPNCDDISTTYYDTSFNNPVESDLFVTRDASQFYCSFLGADDRITEINTNVKKGKTLVVIKESYGNALLPFLTSSFENIYVIDLRYFYLNAIDFIKKVGATDLLFANCAYTPAGGTVEYLEDIRVQ